VDNPVTVNGSRGKEYLSGGEVAGVSKVQTLLKAHELEKKKLLEGKYLKCLYLKKRKNSFPLLNK